MDDILYIILGVAWLAWSLYSNKLKQDKKRAEQSAEIERRARQQNVEQHGTPVVTSYDTPSPPVIKKSERSILEEIFGEEFTPHDEAEEEIYIPEVDERGWQAKRKQYADSEARSLETITEEVSSDYFEKQYSDRNQVEKQSFKVAESINEVEAPAYALVEDFDLKRAVIYSEILRAPYISV